MGNGVFRASDGMAMDARMIVNLIIIPALHSLIPEKVHLLKALPDDVLQAIRLVPANGENVNGDLASNGKAQAIIRKLLLIGLDHAFADVVLCVVLGKRQALFVSAGPANRAYVNHGIAKFHKGTALDGNVQIGQIMQCPVHLGPD